MESTFILQKLKYESDTNYVLAERYYALLSALNNMKLTEREIQLVAFTAVRGNISYANIREDFCKRYGTTSPTINNMISKMKKLGVMIKTSGKVKVNPVLILDFNKDVKLFITFTHAEG